MDKVINDLLSMAAIIVERIVLAIPDPGTPHYWAMLGAMIGLTALLVIWLAFRLRRASTIDQPPLNDVTEITFSDVTAQAAADARSGAPDDNAVQMEEIVDLPPRPMAADTAPEGSAPAEVAQPAAGFKFFKKQGKAGAADAGPSDKDDDVFLLGLEQEMLATRQLYLDGMISKEVYVMETRALYDKAQTRMT
jgi:hypothetical protein